MLLTKPRFRAFVVFQIRIQNAVDRALSNFMVWMAWLAALSDAIVGEDKMFRLLEHQFLFINCSRL